ncbi:hypothetical protein [Limibacterium fermenti]|uniref:hypothetical protein n=1 Tax=Limibacterium fermenti TaxID=3229863 RepID=UPI000E8D8611|nr:hypothetical protein [Porphyromonadaceae bacterium]
MKKRIFIAAVLLCAFAATSFSQKASIIEEVFRKSAEDKVARMQQLIGFDDAQADRLKTVEFRFLLEVNDAEHCFLCNKSKRIRKLQQAREEELQKILRRDEYIKYDAIDKERIKEILHRPLISSTAIM